MTTRRILPKEAFIAKFLHDQKKYRARNKRRRLVYFTGKQKNDIIMQYKKGHSLTAIAEAFKCSRKTITRRLISWGEKKVS